MDPLADVLTFVGVRGTVAARVEASEPWGLDLAQVPGAAFHAMTSGTAWLQVDGGQPVRLMPGDLVLLPRGVPHRLASEPTGPLVAFDLSAAKRAGEAGGILHVGDGGPTHTRILCASYWQDQTTTTPLLELLPELVHTPAGSGGSPLDDTVHLLANELKHPDIGTSALLNRLVDVLLIQILRTWLQQHPEQLTASWLLGLRDPVTASALAAIHSDPAKPWTVETLADVAAVSRSTLARRFASLVGETPNAYLTRWRMDIAARRLRDSDEPVEKVARSVGYTSEFAFSRAFSRSRSHPPGRYRKLNRADNRSVGTGEALQAR